jgi:Spy/CpxP family protein refolding chaperone
MKRKLLAASAALLLGTATAACSQPYGGMGPGMMGGYGPGSGQGYGQGQGYGPGYGMGPGMMGGYGPGYGMGPGMMGGYGPGYGMGPGMMGGYGPGGMGPGMMGGYGPGYGMGPGMMGGYGPGGMGPGMMGGYGPGYGMGPGMMGGYGGYGGYGVDLSPEQRAKIADMQQEFARKQWESMAKMHAEGGPMYQAFGPGAFDEKAARNAYQAMVEAQKQMFEASLQMRKKIDGVLTPEQREQMGRGWRGRGPR